MLRIIISCFFCLSAFLAYAQQPDSLPRPRKRIIIKPVVQMDFRNSFIRDSPIKIYGANAGIRIGKYQQITLGLYGLTNESKQQVLTRNRRVVNIEQSLALWHLSLCYTAFAFNNRYFDLGFPLEIGGGNAHEEIKDPQGRVFRTFDTRLLALQAGLLLHLKLTKWLGVKGSIGYREANPFTQNTKPSFADGFDGMYYGYGAKVYLDNIWDSLRKRRRKTFFFPTLIEDTKK